MPHDDSQIPIVYTIVPCSQRYFADVIGFIPRFARPSVMRIIILSPCEFLWSISAFRRASPMFVPERPGSCCFMVSVDIFFTTFMIQFLSYVSGERMNGFPAKMMSPNWFVLSCSRDDISTSLAFSRRFGAISSASIDFEISSTNVILLSDIIGFF